MKQGGPASGLVVRPANVDVSLSSRTPNASIAWDAAHALGRAVIDRHPDVETCTVWVHANRRAGLRWRLGRSAYLSLHWALTPHVDGVLAILGGDRDAWDELQVVLPSPPAPTVDAKGRVHDLDAVMAQQRTLLPVHGDVSITWGRYSGRAPRRVLRLGSCEPGDPPMIRIHPVLDHETVPGWFVGFLVYHELLHVVFPPQNEGGRRRIHSPALRDAERAHPDFARSTEWERRNLHILLQRCAR